MLTELPPRRFTLHPGPLWSGIATNAVKVIFALDQTKLWDIEIRPHVKVRTDRQRKSLFGPAYNVLMEFMGLRGDEDKRYLHRYFCIKYFGPHPKLPNRPKRTTTKNEDGEQDEISTKEALAFYAFVQQQASAEYGVIVPDPEPVWKEEM